MTTQNVRWTTTDLELLSTDEWKRHEIIDGELFVTRAPHFKHQRTIRNVCTKLQHWSEESGQGEAFPTPGVIYSDADNVIPDVIWISHERLNVLVDEEGHFNGSPELIVEILSPGTINERRDREVKLKLYSSKGVQEYWILDWRLEQVEIYRRESAQLSLVATLLTGDDITSPLLPGFQCQVQHFFH